MEKTIKTKESWMENSYFTKDEYEKLYNESINDPTAFWEKLAKNIDWMVPFSRDSIRKVNFSKILRLRRNSHLSFPKGNI